MIANSPQLSTSPPATVSPRYLPLYLYLNDRRAEIVVLTFAEIERLLGFPLPELARKVSGWWESSDPDSSPSPQSGCWTQANMLAKPSLATETIVFERACEAA